jgi:hypothetical protein
VGLEPTTRPPTSAHPVTVRTIAGLVVIARVLAILASSWESPLSGIMPSGALARDADRNHPDEVGSASTHDSRPTAKDRRTLGLGIHVMRRAPH